MFKALGRYGSLVSWSLSSLAVVLLISFIWFHFHDPSTKEPDRYWPHEGTAFAEYLKKYKVKLIGKFPLKGHSNENKTLQLQITYKRENKELDQELLSKDLGMRDIIKKRLDHMHKTNITVYSKSGKKYLEQELRREFDNFLKKGKILGYYFFIN